jgi:hypothetical protein
MLLSCLHTADSNVAVFDAALSELGRDDVRLRHAVRADLLDRAERDGGLTAAIAAETAAVLGGLAGAADAVLLTCSTLGPAVARTTPSTAPVLRVDEALARQAVRQGGTVVALCAVATTVPSTRELFERAAVLTGATIEVRLVPGAWDAFRAGRQEHYLALVAAAADLAFAEGAAAVALAQASMADAVRRCRAGRPLASPLAGLKAAVAAAGECPQDRLSRSPA